MAHPSGTLQSQPALWQASFITAAAGGRASQATERAAPLTEAIPSMSLDPSVDTGHRDLIHDIALDYFGRRMATCSSDQTIRVWDLETPTSSPSSPSFSAEPHWQCNTQLKGHSGSIWRLAWAHPEFGQIIASCSADRTVIIWEEMYDDQIDPTDSTVKVARTWTKRTTLVDSKKSVVDVEFSPRALSLQLAACCADGCVRIYEAPDVLNLTQWTIQHEISVIAQGARGLFGLPASVSWNPAANPNAHSAAGSVALSCAVTAPLIAVGTEHGGNPAVSSASGSLSTAAAATGPSPSAAISSSSSTAGGRGDVAMLGVWELNEASGQWALALRVPEVHESVHDVAFAPNLGRSFHLLAAATDLCVVLVRIEPLRAATQSQSQQSAAGGDLSRASYKVHRLLLPSEASTAPALQPYHQTWRVAWNVTGTVLASSGVDGRVQLWRAGADGNWLHAATLTPPALPTPNSESAFAAGPSTMRPLH